MASIRKYLFHIKSMQWILIGAGLILGAVALILGVADNPPGIILMYLSLTCLAGALVWDLASARSYWITFLISLAAFPVGVVLHNVFYGLAELAANLPLLKALMEAFHVFFFLIAVMAVGPTTMAALIGGVISSWRGMSRLTRKNRSVRRFKEKHEVKEKVLYKLVNLARQSASGANLQPLKFILSCTASRNQKVFSTLSWAGYLKDWPGPEEGERPAAYIVVLGDTDLANNFQYDAGIACQSITLGAVEYGLGVCLIGSINRENLRQSLTIPVKYEILLVIALGKPAEEVILESINEGDDIRYWRDDQGRHHVPKRKLENLILEL